MPQAKLRRKDTGRSMIWILLAALGIPLWMVVGALVGTLLSRRAFKREPGVFPAKLRSRSGDIKTLKSTWKRRPAYARWVHDVLLVQHGVALAQTVALPIATARGAIASDDSGEIKGLGENPLVMTLALDTGASLDLAAPAKARDTMAGPFGEVPPATERRVHDDTDESKNQETR
ncbi:MAG: hypothetical protein ACXWEZ_08905 [Actinomycetota bacterium]